jgi:hypothetical protein
MISWLLSLLRSRKTGSKTINAVYIKKAQAKSLAILKPKRPRLPLQDWFLSWVNSPSPHCDLCPGAPGGERRQDFPPPTLRIGYHPSKPFSLSKSDVRAGWPLAVPGQLQEELGRLSPQMSSPLSVGGCMSTITSTFRSAMNTLRKVEK